MEIRPPLPTSIPVYRLDVKSQEVILLQAVDGWVAPSYCQVIAAKQREKKDGG
jgi:hypothetical protein